jgi:hypothetical protein
MDLCRPRYAHFYPILQSEVKDDRQVFCRLPPSSIGTTGAKTCDTYRAEKLLKTASLNPRQITSCMVLIRKNPEYSRFSC